MDTSAIRPSDDALRREVLSDPDLHDSIETVVRLRGVPDDRVEDVIHDVLEIAWKKKDLPLTDREQVRLILGGIARNRSKDEARARKRKARRQGVQAPEKAADAGPPVDVRVLAAIVVAEVRRRFGRHGEWWIRHVVYGEKHADIAARAGVHVVTVQKGVARVRRFAAKMTRVSPRAGRRKGRRPR